MTLFVTTCVQRRMEEREAAGKSYMRLKKQLLTMQKRSASKAMHSKSKGHAAAAGPGVDDREVSCRRSPRVEVEASRVCGCAACLQAPCTR